MFEYSNLLQSFSNFAQYSSMLIKLIPFIGLGSLIFFRNFFKHKPILVTLFLSIFFFATNFEDYGTNTHFFRFVHKFIGVVAILHLFFLIFKKRIDTSDNPIVLPLVGFFLAIIFSAVGNSLDYFSYLALLQNFIFVSLVSVYISYQISSKEDIHTLTKLILLFCGIFFIGALYDILRDMIFMLDGFGSQKRVSIHFSNPNFLAYYLNFCLALVVFSKLKRKLLLSTPIIFLIIFTQSLSSIGGSLVILILYFSFKEFISLKFLIVSVFSIAIGFSYWISLKDSNSTRMNLIEIGVNMFVNNPGNGIGYGQFKSKFQNYTDSIKNFSHEMDEVIMSHDNRVSDAFLESHGLIRKSEKMTHNDLLTIISELGIFGIAAILYIFLFLYRQLSEVYSKNKRLFYMSFSLITYSFLFSLFHNNMTSIIFWLIISFPAVINRILSNKIS